MVVQTSIGQDFSALWEGHFSYLNIKDVSQGNAKVFAAAENAIFTYDELSNDIEKISTIDGLSGETITNIHYSEEAGLLLIGYENGLIDIVFDSDQDVLTVVDILEKETIPPNNKRINHFNEHDGLVYIATDYGISVYDLARLEFGDSYYIGALGSQKIITQTTIFNDHIYTSSPTGVQKASISNPNLIDYNQWQTLSTANWIAIEAVEDRLYAQQSNRILHEVVNDAFTAVFTFPILPVDVKSTQDMLIVTTATTIYSYMSDFTLIDSANINGNFNTSFTSGIIGSDNTFYIGTADNGVLIPSTENELGFDEIHPDGPLRNDAFSVKASPNHLWVTFGDYDIDYNAYPLRSRGISQLVDDVWQNKPFDSLLGARNLNKIIVSPDNTEQVFVSSFFSGILEFDNGSPTTLFNQTNSGLESLDIGDPNYIDIRVSGTAFDSDGLLWSVTSQVDNVLKSYDPSSGQWQRYSFNDLISDPFDELGFGDLVIDRNDTKFIGSYALGVIGYNESGSLIKNIERGDLDGNLPGNYIGALAMDNSNQLWIGTNKGLRVLFNTSNFFTDDDITANEIIILEDGVPKELLFQQFITDIEVDGGNNKWIGTLTSGIFFFSPNGQNTIFHFTKDNSPLPSNSITDVTIDESNGEVYIATDKGLVSFNSGGSSPKEGLTDAFVYPNPVRPGFNIIDEKVKIKDLSDNVNIKITDIEGNLVAEANSRTNSRYKGYNLEVGGGTAFWNGKNLANNLVATGVYLVMLSDLDTFETKVLKLMVVR